MSREGTSCGLLHIHQFLLTSPALTLKEINGRFEPFNPNGIILNTLLRCVLCSLSCPDLFSHFSHKSYSLTSVIFAAPFWTPPCNFACFKLMLQTAPLYGQARDLKALQTHILYSFWALFLVYSIWVKFRAPAGWVKSGSLFLHCWHLICSIRALIKEGRGVHYVLFNQASDLV